MEEDCEPTLLKRSSGGYCGLEFFGNRKKKRSIHSKMRPLFYFDKALAISPTFVSVLIILLLHLVSLVNSSQLVTNQTSQEGEGGFVSSTSHFDYDCLPPCQCIYSKHDQHLDIDCGGGRSNNGPMDINNNSNTTTTRLTITHGMATLTVRNALLKSPINYLQTIPQLIKQDQLVGLTLYNVTFDPFQLFNSHLLKASQNSLRTISIKDGSSSTVTEFFTMDYSDQLQVLATLANLDSLTICDGDPVLSQVLLQALPKSLKYLTAVNNSIPEVYYAAFHHLTLLESLNLSHNRLKLIPNSLFQHLTSLTELDVSYNRLYHLQEYVFEGLGSVRRLNLSHNVIEYVDAEVFSKLEELEEVDMNNNNVIQFFEPYFKHNSKLRMVNMSNAWISNTFVNEFTASRSYNEMEGLISTLQSVEEFDLSDNQMTNIPETLSHIPQLSIVHLHGNPWVCTCYERWFLDWIATTNVSIGKNNDAENTFCVPNKDPESPELTTPQPLISYITSLSNSCNTTEITARYPFQYHAVMGKDVMLQCHTVRGSESYVPIVTWITPTKQQISATDVFDVPSPSEEDEEEKEEEPYSLIPNGALIIHKVRAPDYGLYLCVVSYDNLNVTHYVHLGMDVSIFADVRFASIIVGLISSFGFLFLVLLTNLIKCLIMRSGLHCIAVRTAKQTRRVRAFFDSVEQNKNSQLEWLRQNYNMQAKKVQENCISQLERIRESYSNQTKNLSEFRDYSAQQITTIRDQYQDQIRRVAAYSARRLGKVRENYVFSRHRVGKFSSHQLIKLREVYKWQAQALNRILETLPQGLNLDSCRGVATCGRTDSIDFEDLGDQFLTSHSLTTLEKLNKSSSSLCSVVMGTDSSNDKSNEHISLLIPPEFLAQYLLPPIPLFDQSLPSTSTASSSGSGSTSTSSTSHLPNTTVLYRTTANSPDRRVKKRRKSVGDDFSNLPFADEDV